LDRTRRAEIGSPEGPRLLAEAPPVVTSTLPAYAEFEEIAESVAPGVPTPEPVLPQNVEAKPKGQGDETRQVIAKAMIAEEIITKAIIEKATDETLPDATPVVVEAALAVPIEDEPSPAQSVTMGPSVAETAVAASGVVGPVAAESVIAEAAAVETPAALTAAEGSAAAEAVAVEAVVAEAGAVEPPPVEAAAAEPVVAEAEAVAPGVAQATAEAPTAAEASPAEVASAEPVAAPTATESAGAVPVPIVIPKDYVPAAESEHALYQIQVDAFEGPLDLLLFLIRRHELDIFNIPMAFVCDRYLHYLKVMQDLNLDVAAEFLFTAAELVHIKSRMLLPKPEGSEGEEEEIDPRAELVQRLLEYERFKAVAQQLEGGIWLGRDTFGRQPEVLPKVDPLSPLKEVGIFALVEAFDAMLKRQKPEFRHQVIMDTISVGERMRRLIQSLADGEVTPFEQLMGTLSGRMDIVVTFLALLEMTRLQLVGLYQSLEGLLYVRRRFTGVEQALGELRAIDETALAR